MYITPVNNLLFFCEKILCVCVCIPFAALIVLPTTEDYPQGKIICIYSEILSYN